MKKPILVRFEEKTYDLITKLAKESNRSRGNFVEVMVSDYMNER